MNTAQEHEEQLGTERHRDLLQDEQEPDVPTRQYRTPRVYERDVLVAGRAFRPLFIIDLGHEEPTR